MTTSILKITEIADGEINQYLRVNQAFRDIESACNSTYVVDLVSADSTVTNAEPDYIFSRNFIFVAINNTVARIINMPEGKRAYSVVNTGSADLKVKRGTTEVAIAAGSSAILYQDGTANGLGLLTSSSGGGGLSNFSSSLSTAAPNDSVNTVSLAVTGSAANIDMAVIPKGSGALLVKVPNGLAGAGNKRGAYAVDLQLANNDTANKVASGISSFAVGVNNRASGAYSVALGRNNQALAQGAVALGDGSIASNANAISFGGASATGEGAVAAMLGAIASGGYSVALGEACLASSNNSFSTGKNSNSRNAIGMRAHASGIFSSDGDAQYSRLVLRRLTTTSASTVLTSNNTAASTNNQLVLPNASLFTVKGFVSARESSTGDSKSWEFSASVKRLSGAGTTALVAAVTPVVVAADAGASAWSLSVSADTTNGALAISAVGENSKTIKWVCVLESCELVG